MSDFRLRKKERLKSRKVIGQLFMEGKSVRAFPVRVIWCTHERLGEYPAQAAFSVPKRLFKRAWQRNLLKRRLREAYRLNKAMVYDQADSGEMQISLMIVYTSPEVQTFDTIQQGLVKALGLMMHKQTR